MSPSPAQRKRLNAQLERMYHEEFNEISTSVDEGMSVEDRKAQRIMDQSATLVDGHYQVKLPIRKTTPDLPDSLPTAEKRLRWLTGKFQKNPVFHCKYSIVKEKDHREKCQITRYLNSGLLGFSLIMQCGTPGSHRNQEWCLNVHL